MALVLACFALPRSRSAAQAEGENACDSTADSDVALGGVVKISPRHISSVEPSPQVTIMRWHLAEDRQLLLELRIVGTGDPNSVARRDGNRFWQHVAALVVEVIIGDVEQRLLCGRPWVQDELHAHPQQVHVRRQFNDVARSVQRPRACRGISGGRVRRTPTAQRLQSVDQDLLTRSEALTDAGELRCPAAHRPGDARGAWDVRRRRHDVEAQWA